MSPSLAFAVVSLCFAGCGQPDPHPKDLAGSWRYGSNVHITFAEDGKVSIRTDGAAVMPLFIYNLGEDGRWEVAEGALRLMYTDENGAEVVDEYQYELENDGRVLRATGTRGLRLSRE